MVRHISQTERFLQEFHQDAAVWENLSVDELVELYGQLALVARVPAPRNTTTTEVVRQAKSGPAPHH